MLAFPCASKIAQQPPPPLQPRPRPQVQFQVAALVEHCPRALADARPIPPSSLCAWPTARRSAHQQQPPHQLECAAGKIAKPCPHACPQTRAAMTRTAATAAVAFGALGHLWCWSEVVWPMSVLSFSTIRYRFGGPDLVCFL